jgi:hypothetical protein
MATPVQPFGSVERAVMALLVRDYAPLTGLEARIGGEFPDSTLDQWYVRVDKVSGGRTDSFGGDFLVDVEVFSQDYLNAEKIALDIEALMLAHGYHVVLADGKRWVIDDVQQNIGVADRPWDGDDDTYRMSASYALTARRRAGTGAAIPAPPPPDGPTAGGAAYAHQQTINSNTWIVNHDLGYRPGGVRVTADNGDTYFPVVVDLDENTIRLTLAEAVTGWAYVS